MLWISLFLTLFFGVGLGMRNDSYDDGESRGDQSYYGADIYREGDIYEEVYDDEESTSNPFDEYKEALNALLGSEEHISDVLDHDFNFAKYLQFAKAKFYISQAIDKPENYSRLTSAQKEEITKVIKILEEKMAEASDEAEQKWLVDTLIAQSEKMANFLPVSVVFEHFEDLTNCQDGYLVSLWRDIIDISSDSDSLGSAIEGLVEIGQSIRNVTFHRGYISEIEVKSSKDRIKLLSMLSQPTNKMFAVRAFGGTQQLEDLVQTILCGELKLSLVDWMLEKLVSVAKEKDFAKRLITNPEDMTTLIEMQTTLGVITNDLAETEKLFTARSRGLLPNLGHHILNSYMDLLDTAVNKETLEIWAQMSPEEANEKLHRLLLSNERYVGSVSNVILGLRTPQKSYQLEKDSVSVSISKVHLDENNNTSAEFTYEDTIIKTDDMAQLDIADGDDLRVYTLRYKSWSDLIRDILLKHMDLEKNLTTHQMRNLSRRRRSVDESVDGIMVNKTFIGKGGVVSLSVKQNGVKRSLPATYWIGFNNATNSYGGNVTCVRLSCEYLDPETITWESRGCRVENVDRYGITCKCNHTTNFAAFMMPTEPLDEPTKEEAMALRVLSMVGSFLSILGLLGTLTVFYLVRHLVRNDRLKAHGHLSFSLIVVNVTYLLGDLLISNNVMCVISTMVSHYFLLAVFMWMLIEGIFLYLYVVQVFLRSKVVSYNWMYFVGWGIPALIVAVSAGYGIPNGIYVMPAVKPSEESKPTSVSCPDGSFQYPPKQSDPDIEEVLKYERCWLSTESGVIWAFLTPAVLVLAFNTAIMCKTLRICIKSLRNQQRMRSKSEALVYNGHHSSSGFSKDSSSRTHSSSFSDLHGRPGPPSRQVSAPSPCLLQVTTEEEKSDMMKRDRISSLSSIDNTYLNQDNAKAPLQREDRDKEGGFRYHSVSGDSSRIQNSRASVMYRNSVSKNSPRFSSKSKSIGGKMARLTSERVAFFRDAKAAVKGTIILLPILGLPWILGFFTHLSVAIMFMFVILNSTQGIAIFVVYGLCNGEVRRAMKRRAAVRNMKHSMDGGIRRTSSTSTARSFLRFGRRRSTFVTST